jgi:hypothetical protein
VLRHIVLASGTDIPLRLMGPALLPPGVTLYGSYDYDAQVYGDLQGMMYDALLPK